MPAILIGLGGTGGEIVNDVRRKVEFAVETAGNTQAARQLANEIRYFLVDTRTERFHKSFPPTAVFDLPRTGQKFGVDRRVQAMWNNPNDAFFRLWWPPSADGGPYLPGDFNQGAGQVRVKGKLGYRFHLAQPDGVPLAFAVRTAAEGLMDALGPAASRDNTQIPVYLICSLGGGTGSGMSLTIAQHLKQHLPRYCALIGAFLLASVTEKAPHNADQASIWANTDAALREIDFFQTRHRERSLRPFLSWPGQGNEIDGNEPPFLYCYLYGSTNRRNLTLHHFDDYVRLVSECLVAEVMEPLAMAISGPHAQFVQQFQDRQTITARPTAYASAAKADVVYPVERIVRHLSRRFGAKVLQARFQPPAETSDVRRGGVAAADTYLADAHLLWTTGKTLRSLLYVTVGSGEEGSLPEGEFPLDESPPIDEVLWEKAKQQVAVEMAQQQQQALQEYRNTQLIPFLRRRRDDQVAKHCGAGGRMVAALADLLGADGGDGYLRARAAVDRLVETLRDQAAAVREQIDGEPEERGADRDLGLKRRAAALEDAFDDHLADLRTSFHWSQFLNPGAAGKNRFTNDWLRPYRDTLVDLQIAQEARTVYQELLASAERLQQIFRQFDSQFRGIAERLTEEANRDLGTGRQGDVLEVGVLDHPDLVDFTFFGRQQQALDDHAGRVGRRLIVRDGGVRAAVLDEFAHPPRVDDLDVRVHAGALGRRLVQALLDEARDVFQGMVENLTIWHALEAECEARQARPELMDEVLRGALEATQSRTEELDEQGAGDRRAERELLRHYIERKLNILKNRAHPFWQLDPAKIDSYGPPDIQLPYPLTVLAYDRYAYDQFLVERRMDDLMEDVAGALQVRQTALPGKYAIRLYAREGVVPLFFLDEREIRDLRNRSEQVAANKPLYGDRRYEGVLDRAMTAGEQRADSVRYALACAIQFGLADTSAPGGNGRSDERVRFRVPLDGVDEPRFATLSAAQQRFEEDAAYFDPLRDRLDDDWTNEQQIPNRHERLEDVIAFAEREIGRAADDRDRAWWLAAAAVLRDRLVQRRYTVAR